MKDPAGATLEIERFCVWVPVFVCSTPRLIGPMLLDCARVVDGACHLDVLRGERCSMRGGWWARLPSEVKPMVAVPLLSPAVVV